MDERLERLLNKPKASTEKRKMGNTSNVWTADDLKRSTIVIDEEE